MKNKPLELDFLLQFIFKKLYSLEKGAFMKRSLLLIITTLGLGSVAMADPCGTLNKLEYFCADNQNVDFKLAVCTDNEEDQVSSAHQEYVIIESEIDNNSSSFFYRTGLEATAQRSASLALGPVTFKMTGQMNGELIITRNKDKKRVAEQDWRQSTLSLKQNGKIQTYDMSCRYIGEQVTDEYYGE